MSGHIPDDVARILVVEGPGDECVFKQLLRYLKVENQLHLISCGGKGNLSRTLANILNFDHFTQLSCVGIVCDNDYVDSRQGLSPMESVAKQISTANQEVRNNHRVRRELPVPATPRQLTSSLPHLSVLLLPNDTDDGAVENLVLQAIGRNKIMACVDSYLECLRSEGLNPQSAREARSKLSIYLSGKVLDKRYANNDDSRREFLSQAVEMKWWRDENMWDSPAFDNAKAFLRQLLAD